MAGKNLIKSTNEIQWNNYDNIIESPPEANRTKCKFVNNGLIYINSFIGILDPTALTEWHNGH